MAAKKSGRKSRETPADVAQRARAVANSSRNRRNKRRAAVAGRGFSFGDLINTYSIIAVGTLVALGIGLGAIALFGPDEEERRRLMDEGASTLKRLQKRLPSLDDLSSLADEVSGRAQKIAKSARDAASRYS